MDDRNWASVVTTVLFKGGWLQEIQFICPNEMEVNILKDTDITIISDFSLSISETQLIR